MDANSAGKVPTTFWVIAVLGLLWNAFGAYLYLLARLDPQTALAGADPAMKNYVANQPIWANIGYGLGIWGSFFGSVAMVLRSRQAVNLFLASLVGAAISHLGQAMAGVIPVGLAVMIMAVIAFLWWYSRRCAEQGLLR
ncbi:MAG: hypothetical protein ACKOPM_02685 [Novosphingobium sp.]